MEARRNAAVLMMEICGGDGVVGEDGGCGVEDAGAMLADLAADVVGIDSLRTVGRC